MTRAEFKNLKVGDKIRIVQLGCVCNAWVRDIEECAHGYYVRANLLNGIWWGDDFYRTALEYVDKNENYEVGKLGLGWAKKDHEDITARSNSIEQVIATQELDE